MKKAIEVDFSKGSSSGNGDAVLQGEDRFSRLYARYIPAVANKIGTKGVAKGGSRWIHFKCPLHDDNRPSAGVDVHSGVFSCHICGNFKIGSFLQRLLGIDEVAASAIVESYLKDAGLQVKEAEFFTNTMIADPRWEDIYSQAIRDAGRLGRIPMVRTYMASRGLALETLVHFGVGWLPAYLTNWKRDSLVFPYFRSGKLVGLRYRDEHGNKGGEEGCHFCLWNCDSLAAEGVRYAVVVEGESDCLRTWQSLFGVNSGGSIIPSFVGNEPPRTEGNVSWSDLYPNLAHVAVVSTPTGAFRREWARDFEGFVKVLCIPQDDEHSQKLLEKAKLWLGYRASILMLPWRRGQSGKDVCEWHMQEGNREDTFRALVVGLLGDGNRRVMTGAEFRKMASKEREYMIDRMLSAQEGVMVGGLPKMMKTWVLFNLVRALIHPDRPEFLSLPGLRRSKDLPPLKVLIIEEEGNEREILERAEMVFQDVPNWEENTLWAHQLRVRLDEEGWVQRLEDIIEEHQISVLMGDPFQRMHSQDENSASEMAIVSQNLARLTARFRGLSTVLLHHFNKMGDISQGWSSLRGSIRIAADADLGIFVEKGHTNDGRKAIRFKIEGRSLKSGSPFDEVIERVFDEDTGLFEELEEGVEFHREEDIVGGKRNSGPGGGNGGGSGGNSGGSRPKGPPPPPPKTKPELLIDFVDMSGGEVLVVDACKKFGASPEVITRWVNQTEGRLAAETPEGSKDAYLFLQ